MFYLNTCIYNKKKNKFYKQFVTTTSDVQFKMDFVLAVSTILYFSMMSCYVVTLLRLPSDNEFLCTRHGLGRDENWRHEYEILILRPRNIRNTAISNSVNAYIVLIRALCFR